MTVEISDSRRRCELCGKMTPPDDMAIDYGRAADGAVILFCVCKPCNANRPHKSAEQLISEALGEEA